MRVGGAESWRTLGSGGQCDLEVSVICRSQTQCLSLPHLTGKCNLCPPRLFWGVCLLRALRTSFCSLSVLLMLADEELAFLLGDADYFPVES